MRACSLIEQISGYLQVPLSENWQSYGAGKKHFFKNLGEIEKSNPFFNESISSSFNWYFDRFVTISYSWNGDIVFLMRLWIFFWWVFKIFSSFFNNALDEDRRDQEIPSHLDLINRIFFSQTSCKFFCYRHLLCKAFFKIHVMMDLISPLFANGISNWINFRKTLRVLQFLKKFISNNALFLFL